MWTHRGQCGHLVWLQKKKEEGWRCRGVKHTPMQSLTIQRGKVFSVQASEGGVCSVLALCVYSLSAPQVSIHYLKTCIANPSGLFCDWAGPKVRNWQSWNCWRGCWKVYELGKVWSQWSIPRIHAYLDYFGLQQTKAPRENIPVFALSLVLSLSLPLFNNGLLFFIPFAEIQTI